MLVSAHDAFGYFGRAYGFEVMGIQGISTESEAGLARIEALVDVLVDRRIPAYSSRTSVSDRNVKALIEGASRRAATRWSSAEACSPIPWGRPGTYEGPTSA